MTERLAVCSYYGVPWGRGAGPIVPDGQTFNGGICGPDGCFCVVPSDPALPFLMAHDTLKNGRTRCAVRGEGHGFDIRGQCSYFGVAHVPMPHIGPDHPQLRQIVTRYVAYCRRCGRPIRPGTTVLWGGPKIVYHLDPALCPPAHDFVERTDLGEDTFYCGCQAWD